MLRRMIRNAVIAAYTLSVTYMAGEWAISYANAHRAHPAVGGEYLFIPLAAWAAYRLINWFLGLCDANMEKERRARRRRHSKNRQPYSKPSRFINQQ